MTLKVIGAGFGRTGTTSIKAALEQLGFDQCYHMQEVIKNPSHVAIWNAAVAGKPVDWDALFAGYQATVDWPACDFTQELMAKYPDAKVLLTVRDPEKKLIRRLVPPMRRFLALNQEMIWQKDFGGRFEDRQHAIAVFNQHNEAIKRLVPAEKLLVYDVKEGWEPLCHFLGVPVPTTPFPHLNDSGTFRRMFRAVDAILVGAVLMLIGALIWVRR